MVQDLNSKQGIFLQIRLEDSCSEHECLVARVVIVVRANSMFECCLR
jgi:hypothetical protein